MELKTCRTCGVPKDRDSDFYMNTVRKRGRVYKIPRPDCKACHVKVDTPRNVEYGRLKRYARRSADIGVICDFDVAYLRSVHTLACAYCLRTGQEMTLDRKEPALGYVRSNVVSCCRLCNQVKSSLSQAAWALILPGVRAAAEAGLL